VALTWRIVSLSGVAPESRQMPHQHGNGETNDRDRTRTHLLRRRPGDRGGGSSPNSLSDAVRTAVKTASQTLRHIRGVEVISSNADVDDDGNLTLYKVNCKIAFVYEGG
jgi:dodecin